MTFRPFGKDVPFSLGEVQNEINAMARRLWESGMRVNPFSETDWEPHVDLYEDPGRFILTAEVPGVEVGAIDVSYSDGVLTLRGDKVAPAPIEGRRRLMTERRYGTFMRAVHIPGSIDADRITATSRAGVIEITMQKSPNASARTIKIESNE
ncbi:MAG: Hsp20/alpha crystallin family protein [Phycisphaerales bacterium]|nr:MAG: Hsp20/alpha crystallin family protein [Phycisphaerales bacterium]